jgi:multiple antibiotic resistance protein
MSPPTVLSPTELFVLLLVILGPPTRVPVEFAARTKGLSERERRSVAIRAVIGAAFVALGGGFIGNFLMSRWEVESPTVLLAGGVVFSIVALRAVLFPDRFVPPPPEQARALDLAFPLLVPPYGIAGIVVLISTAASVSRVLAIMGAVGGVLAIDLLAMWFAPKIMNFAKPAVMRLISAILGIMTVALALQIDLIALRRLSIVPQ